jgi:hypothetical protein
LIFEDIAKICCENVSLIKIAHTNQYIFLSYLADYFLEWGIFQANVVEKIQTHILCSVTFIDNRVVYQIRWRNIVELGSPHMTIWRMRIACWITLDHQCTHSEYVILTDFPLQEWLNERTSVLSYITSLVYILGVRWPYAGSVPSTVEAATLGPLYRLNPSLYLYSSIQS